MPESRFSTAALAQTATLDEFDYAPQTPLPSLLVLGTEGDDAEVRGTDEAELYDSLGGDDPFVSGIGGNDVFIVGRGADQMYGGPGDDTALFAGNFDDYEIVADPTEDPSTLTFEVNALGTAPLDSGYDRLKAIEAYEFRDSFWDAGTGVLTLKPQDTGTHVTSIEDNIVADGELTLREAVANANANPGEDTITFDIALQGQTISMPGAGLVITEDLVIDGGPNSTGFNNLFIDFAGGDGFFDISEGLDVTLSDLTLHNRVGAGLYYGGENTALVEAGSRFDDYAATSNVTLQRVQLSDLIGPTAEYTYDAGISASGRVAISDSRFDRIDGNAVRARDIEIHSSSIADAGGVFDSAVSGELVIIGDSYFARNSDTAVSGETVRVTNSTFVDNFSNHLYNPSYRAAAVRGDRVTIADSTITGNQSYSDTIEGEYGTAGISASESLTLSNSIVVGNIATGSEYTGGGGYVPPAVKDVYLELGARLISNGHNLISQDVLVGAAPSDQLGISANQVFAETDLQEGSGVDDPIPAGVPADHGGPTPTVALRDDPSNPALDAGDPLRAADGDQRGVARGPAPDIGAFELRSNGPVFETIDYVPQTLAPSLTVLGTPGDDPQVRGTDAAELYDALAGNDLFVSGIGGDDVFLVGFGRDQMYGGSGHDTGIFNGLIEDYERIFDGINVWEFIDLDPTDGDTGYDRMKAFETFEFRNAFMDAVTGTVTYKTPNLLTDNIDVVDLNKVDVTTLANATDALGEADEITLSDSQNAGVPFFGDAGNDRLLGGFFADTLFGGAGRDVLRGGRGGDFLSGGADEDQLFGTNGDDIIKGGGGRDKLRGDPGDDRLNGGQGIDKLIGGDDDDLLLGGTENDRLIGNAGNDQLFGEQGNDKLFGQGGRDILSGGAGTDLLTGGTGIDTFLAVGGGFDTEKLLDFNPDQDIVRLEHVLDTEHQPIATFADLDTSGDGVLSAADENVVEAAGNTVLKIFFAGNEQIWFDGISGGILDAGNFEFAAAADDFPADSTTNGIVSVNQSANGRVERPFDEDWFRIEAEPNELYIFDLRADDSSAARLSDPYLYLYDAAGGYLDEDDDGGDGLESRLLLTTGSSGGTYYLGAAGYSDNAGDYVLSAAEYGNNDTISGDLTTTTTLTLDVSFASDIDYPNDQDWFRIELVGGNNYAFELSSDNNSNSPLGDPYLYLYDSTGGYVDENDDSGVGLDSRVYFQPDADGVFYIAATGLGNSTGSYLLSANVSLPGPVVEITNVPAYNWYHGCSPTATGSIFGYYDLNGFPEAFDAEGQQAVFQTPNVQDHISSAEHNAKYDPTPDNPEVPIPASISIADFMFTSVDPLEFGHTYIHNIDDGIRSYANFRGFEMESYNANNSEDGSSSGTLWSAFTQEINYGRPVLLHVDSNGDGAVDHSIPVFAYEDRGVEGRWYGAYTTWSETETPIWREFQPVSNGQPWGVYSMTVAQTSDGLLPPLPPLSPDPEDGPSVASDRDLASIEAALAPDDIFGTAEAKIFAQAKQNQLFQSGEFMSFADSSLEASSSLSGISMNMLLPTPDQVAFA